MLRGHFLSAALVSTVALVAGCNSSSTSTSGNAGGQSQGGAGGQSQGGAGGQSQGGAGGQSQGGGGAGGGSADALVRVAHLGADAPPVDFCVSADAGATFIGPVMGGVLGDADGLAYPEVTTYLALPPATYTVRLVAPGSADCATSLAGLPDITGLAVVGGSSYTAAATGLLAAAGEEQPFQVVVYEDANTPATGKINLRVVHSSPNVPAVDVGILAAGTFTALTEDLAFPDAAQLADIDPVSDLDVSIRLAGDPNDVLVLEGVTIGADTAVSVFATGIAGGNTNPLGVLVCGDNAPPVGTLSDCTLVIP
jgi:hypothetical protein